MAHIPMADEQLDCRTQQDLEGVVFGVAAIHYNNKATH